MSSADKVSKRRESASGFPLRKSVSVLPAEVLSAIHKGMETEVCSYALGAR